VAAVLMVAAAAWVAANNRCRPEDDCHWSIATVQPIHGPKIACTRADMYPGAKLVLPCLPGWTVAYEPVARPSSVGNGWFAATQAGGRDHQDAATTGALLRTDRHFLPQ